MIRQLLLLPVKVPLAAAGFALEVVKELLGVKPEPAASPPPAGPGAPPRAQPQPRGEEPVVEGVTVRPEPEIEPEAESDPEDYRREEHEAEFGTEGGAEVRVEEPWEGYDRMNADEIVRRLRGADGAKLAIVRLYEANHRNRATVLRAADSQVAGRAGTNGA
jgi:hypothetical protein